MHEEVHVSEGAAHGACGAEDVELGGEAGGEEVFHRERVGGGFEAVDTGLAAGPADGAAYVGADAEDGAFEGDEGGFPACGAAGGEVDVVGVEGAAVVGVRF